MFGNEGMPLFRKQSTKAKKRLQHQQYLAKESPEKTYDISGTEITDVPQGTYSLCKVLQKEVFIAHSNWLTCLKGGGEMKDLQALRVLDLHDNELTTLPDDVGHLRCLQVLILENNKLKHLPPSIGQLTALQTLNLRGNKLKSIPGTVKDLQCLRTLDISKNHVTSLPQEMCYIRTLENIIVDTDHMTYPSSEICSQGTETLMKFLCSEHGLTYEPPSKFLLDVLDGQTPVPSSPLDNLKANMDAINVKVTQYELAKSARQQEVMMLEKQIEEENRLQAMLAAKAARNKQHLVDYVAHDQERLQDELSSLQHSRDQEHKRLLKTLYDAEQTATDLVANLLEMNERAKKTEELVEHLEKERIDSEEWFKVRQEEVDNLRKQEVLGAMRRVLAENEALREVITNFTETKDEARRKAQDAKNITEDLVENVLLEKHMEQLHLIEYLNKEEQLQKEAFVVLQLQQDTKHLRIMSQIDLIHNELARLTLVELKQRDTREEVKKNILEDKRHALTEFLVQLMKEKSQREGQLQKRLLEMEEQREADQTDYWLVQYQRLMDRKPQALLDREKRVEFAVIEILEAADAKDYIPVFVRHRIFIETMCTLSEDDLKHMGMYEVGKRKSVLREIENYKLRMEEEHAAAKLKGIQSPENGVDECPKKSVPPPLDIASSATPSAPQKSPMTPTSPPLDVIARGLNSECVICMERQSSILFLYCGHVCSCQQCAEPLEECPMCRGEILHRIFLA